MLSRTTVHEPPNGMGYTHTHTHADTDERVVDPTYLRPVNSFLIQKVSRRFLHRMRSVVEFQHVSFMEYMTFLAYTTYAPDRKATALGHADTHRARAPRATCENQSINQSHFVRAARAKSVHRRTDGRTESVKEADARTVDRCHTRAVDETRRVGRRVGRRIERRRLSPLSHPSSAAFSSSFSLGSNTINIVV